MTSPLEEPSVSPQRPRKNWLLRYLGVQEKYDAIIATALLDAAEDAEQGIRQRLGDDRLGSSTRRYQLQLARSAARDSLKLLFRNVHSAITAGQSEAAVAAVEAGFHDDRRILNRLFPNRARRAKYEDSMRQSASRGVQAMMTRVLQSNRPLSQRVYHTQALANGTVDRVINSALVKGDGAADIAKAVRQSIRPDVPGGVSYAAMRLGRTEINNAFHAQAINDINTKPWVDHVEWHLSKTHKEQGCRCEVYARIKRFPKEAIPDKPHPQCLCYITASLTPWEEFENNFLMGMYDSYIDNNLR
ncbi:hypothetical protein PBI_BIGMAMA_11 [Mycobacterium phage BigMama]|uniref:MuF-like minor capsid protein n=8 Tax=Plotvirus plot TaxID=2170099 RepID=A0A2Z4Q017_9CAUD|nr:putative head protein [Mycobacterium phage Butterscotch]AEK10222.1 hypothetical protein PBI_SIRHARLEY_12 [Mycobacterium phage SirHarley]AER49766.1 putative minor head protein [Mycobacterium phage Nova]AVP43110.1 hypothetical protein PBI_BIGMAMA_11 [Mycobacterium phage BigMama]AWY03457.1 hypothetical protein ERK16_13 [Mycobacterium phage Erk16]AYN58155.1 MuF-like minor capsid protein [Mycobacterium phage KandZ]QBJ04728.1 MuF-like minor capsid protein [Mycobacterium phage Delton]QEA11387.1 